MKEGSEKTKIPILILLFAIFIIAASSWWFIQLAIHPKFLLDNTNILYSFTKFGVLVSGVGLLFMRKWSVYLYGTVYCITIVLFVKSPDYQIFSEQIPTVYIIGSIIVLTLLLLSMFCGYWKRLK